MKHTNLFVVVLLAAFVMSCQPDNSGSIDMNVDALDQALTEALVDASGGAGLNSFMLPFSTEYHKIPQDPKNVLNTAKVELGKFLYHETSLGLLPKTMGNVGTYSCASCHFASAGFQASLAQGIGEGGDGFGFNGEGRIPNASIAKEDIDVQPIRTPTTLNGAYQKNMLWNGQFGATGLNQGTEAQWTAGTPKETNHLGFEGLEIQAIAGLAVHRLGMDSSLVSNPVCKTLFDGGFSDIPTQERYTVENVGLAIAAYERTLLAHEAPFQKWLRGNTSAMTDQQKEGAALFFGKANCGSCHNGPALNSMEFYALGMNDHTALGNEVIQLDDPSVALGRGGFTGLTEDNYKFKVPQLYNLKDSKFYGHGASFRNIKAVVEYKNAAVSENNEVPSAQLADDFVPLGLNDEEIDAITEFIKEALYDPSLQRFEPNATLSGNCFPVADPTAKTDLGCD